MILYFTKRWVRCAGRLQTDLSFWWKFPQKWNV